MRIKRHRRRKGQTGGAPEPPLPTHVPQSAAETESERPAEAESTGGEQDAGPAQEGATPISQQSAVGAEDESPVEATSLRGEQDAGIAREVAMPPGVAGPNPPEPPSEPAETAFPTQEEATNPVLPEGPSAPQATSVEPAPEQPRIQSRLRLGLHRIFD